MPIFTPKECFRTYKNIVKRTPIFIFKVRQVAWRAARRRHIISFYKEGALWTRYYTKERRYVSFKGWYSSVIENISYFFLCLLALSNIYVLQKLENKITFVFCNYHIVKCECAIQGYILEGCYILCFIWYIFRRKVSVLLKISNR